MSESGRIQYPATPRSELKRLTYATSAKAAARMHEAVQLQPRDRTFSLVCRYLASGIALAMSTGTPGEHQSSSARRKPEPLSLLTDGTWIWDTEVAGHAAHGTIFLPRAFIDHVRKMEEVPVIPNDMLTLLSDRYLNLREPTPSQQALLAQHELWVQSKGQSGQKLVSSGDLDLSSLNMAGLELAEADLSGCNLTGSCLADAHLSLANLSGAELLNADLSRANLTHVVLDHALCQGATFTGANLSGASMFQTDCTGATFASADMSGSSSWKSAFDKADFASCLLANAFFENCSMIAARFEKAAVDLSVTFRGIELEPGEFLDGQAAVDAIRSRSLPPQNTGGDLQGAQS